MHVGGLFVGVDAQEDESGIRALAFAGADAEALHACFADLNEGGMDDAILVTGRAATRSAVLDALDRLAERSVAQPYDLAVVHVSSHGSSDGTLLLFDAVAGSEAETGLPYAEFIERVGRITANHVVVVFDVCYSGLCAGRPLTLRPASEIDEEGGTSAVASDGDPLLQLFQRSAVGNRAIVWAAGPHERAWELPRLGHGLLTYGLLAGLDGTSLAEGGRVSVTRWIEAAIVRAEHEARDAGHLQRPGRAMQWQGTTWMPARPLGPRRAAQLARRDVHAITPDPASLTVYGLSVSACAAVARHIRGGTLNEMQVRAVERAGVMAGKNVLVAAPTSSGKTLIGELAALAAAARRQKTVVLLPTRALTNEKWAEFRSAFGEALGLRTVRSFGGVEDDDLALARNHFDVAFLTYEKFLAMCLARPSLLDVVGTVVLDEVHHMGDVTRGRTVEMLLLLLRRLQQDDKRAARV